MSNQRQLILDVLRESLTIEVEPKQVYSGGMRGDGNMYDQQITIKLLLDGEEISTASIG
jgi:hypothetical protein